MLFCVNIIKVAELVSTDESLKILESHLESGGAAGLICIALLFKNISPFWLLHRNISLLPNNPSQSTLCT